MKKLLDWFKKLLGVSAQKGFTLIELLVVIGILGIMAAVLIVLLDPVDKINAANDSGLVSAVGQFGRANDAYAATHTNSYVGGGTVNAALADLTSAGESKYASYTPPTGYTVNYVTTASCTTAAGTCTQYAFWVTALKSKVNGGPTTGKMYVWANGKGCYQPNGTTIGAGFACP